MISSMINAAPTVLATSRPEAASERAADKSRADTTRMHNDGQNMRAERAETRETEKSQYNDLRSRAQGLQRADTRFTALLERAVK